MDIYEQVSEEEEEGVYGEYIQSLCALILLQQTPPKKGKEGTTGGGGGGGGVEFSELQNHIIGQHFALWIQMGSTPALEKCRNFPK